MVPTALSPEAIYGKSRAFARKALAARGSGNTSDYQMWASLTLEILAKAALAARHPALIVDVRNNGHDNGILNACGISVDGRIATISADLAYSRIKHLAPLAFTDRVYRDSKKLSDARNAHLHSGELPFDGRQNSDWEGDFWRACEVILSTMEKTLPEWLGEQEGSLTRNLVINMRQIRKAAVEAKVNHAKEKFAVDYRSKSAKEAQQNIGADQPPELFHSSFKRFSDAYWRVSCPACEGTAILGGDHVETILAEDQSGADEGLETIEKVYVADEFFCPSCGLNLDGDDQISFSGVETNEYVESFREIAWEPEYGND